MPTLQSYSHAIDQIPPWQGYGKVVAVKGLSIEIEGLSGLASIGSACEIISNTGGKPIKGEIVGFRKEIALMQPYGDLSGLSQGSKVRVDPRIFQLYPHPSWRGRILNAFGEPIDNKGPLTIGNHAYTTQAKPPSAHSRRRLGARLSMGIRTVDLFTTICRGQRMGVFSGSGVGKSLLLSMLAQRTEADISVVGLVGERGRELQEFIQDHLGEEGLKKCVVIVATSDESALLRRQSAWTAMTVAEFFRDQGDEVLFLLDSVTRFAMAQREIGLASGEPPTSKGYPPSTFSKLPQLLERAGPGSRLQNKYGHAQGNITAIVSVLVEGDDFNEPIADTTRGILDGHIVLDRQLAERGQYPAINILRSLSRTVPQCNNDNENKILKQARKFFTVYEKMDELIRIGAYQKGSDKEVDQAITIVPNLYSYFHQEPHVANTPEGFATLYENLASILNIDDSKNLVV